MGVKQINRVEQAHQQSDRRTFSTQEVVEDHEKGRATTLPQNNSCEKTDKMARTTNEEER